MDYLNFLCSSAISYRVHRFISYTSAITEANYKVLAMTNGDRLLWENTHYEEHQAPINCISFPSHLFFPLSPPTESLNLVQLWEWMKAGFT